MGLGQSHVTEKGLPGSAATVAGSFAGSKSRRASGYAVRTPPRVSRIWVPSGQSTGGDEKGPGRPAQQGREAVWSSLLSLETRSKPVVMGVARVLAETRFHFVVDQLAVDGVDE